MFSVIIPTYNGANLLQKSLRSWSRQTFADDEFEVIVVDNNSSEDILSVVNTVKTEINRYSWNVKYILEKKPGATSARHAGAGVARGSVLVFADDDGLYNTGCLKAIADAFDVMPEVGAVACKIDILWDKDAPDWISPYLFMLGKLDYGPMMFSKRNIYFNSGLFAIKRDVFEKCHGFNPDLIGGKIIGDGDTGLVMKLWDAGIPIGWTPDAVMQHMQEVDRHGSVEGVALHFYNVGVANSYTLFRKSNFRNDSQVLKYRFRTLVLFSKKWFQYNILKKRDKKIRFSLKQREGELAFFRNLKEPQIRSEVLKRDLY